MNHQLRDFFALPPHQKRSIHRTGTIDSVLLVRLSCIEPRTSKWQVLMSCILLFLQDHDIITAKVKSRLFIIGQINVCKDIIVKEQQTKFGTLYRSLSADPLCLSHIIHGLQSFDDFSSCKSLSSLL